MEQWEYRVFVADAHVAQDRKVYQGLIQDLNHIPLYSPMTLVPLLNHYGEQGWELMACHPYAFGDRNEDVLAFGGVGSAGRIWTNQYLVIFKRRVLRQ